jgi:Mg2+-importing ATPase
MNLPPLAFWSIPTSALLQQLEATDQGLTTEHAQQRLERFGANRLEPRKRRDRLTLFLQQFKSPIVLILLFAAILSYFLDDPTDAIIILAIILASAALGFWQEYGATNAVEKLLTVVQIKATAFRDGSPQAIPVEDIVPGDIILLRAGDVIPGDCLLLGARDLFVDEAALTGETFPVEKTVGVLTAATPLGQRTNVLLLGTHVVSGTGKAVAVHTGKDTEFGQVSQHLRLTPPETEFERGVRRFGYFLMEVTLLLVMAIFAVNVYLDRPVLDSLLFSLALAVGLTPQLLPAIISINLAHGAKRMAEQKVIVKRLAAIENFGSMNVLCSDKTGTLTEGVVRLHAALDADGQPSDRVLFFAYLNAYYQTGFANPIDATIRSQHQFDVSGHEKLDEVPYDFVRKRLSILVSKDDQHLMVTKGALSHVLDACATVETATGASVALDTLRQRISKHFEEWSHRGFRILGVASRDVGTASRISKDDEAGMTFLGLLVFHDPVKAGIVDTVSQLRHLGVALKIITGDNRLVAATLSQQVDFAHPRLLTGAELRLMSDEALLHQVNEVDVFAEVEPNQKERIILALKKVGNVVGFMGDGINDASALHAADVGISVDSAVDVAKEAADIVLLEQDLGVLLHGVRDGRTTFANTLKYVFMATSANFGNMFSMAGASLFLPFLPLLPTQILLTNLLTDLPEMTIATDRVDEELVVRPRRWDIRFIRNFMLTFGPVSSVFDYLTFGILLFVLHTTTGQFRTGWVLESVVSASLIVLVIRSRRPFFHSRPSRHLLLATLLTVGMTLMLPYTPLGEIFEFRPLPVSFLLVMGLIVGLYTVAAELTKKAFYTRVRF